MTDNYKWFGILKRMSNTARTKADKIMSDGEVRTVDQLYNELLEYYTSPNEYGRVRSGRHMPTRNEVGQYLGRRSKFELVREGHYRMREDNG